MEGVEIVNYTQAWWSEEGQELVSDPPGASYLTLQGVSFLGPGHLQVLGQRRELVAPCPVVVVAGQGLGLPGVDQVHHVHGQVVLCVAAHCLPPVLELTLQLAHPPTVPEAGVVADTPRPDQPPSLLHKVMSVEKLEEKALGSGAGVSYRLLKSHLHVLTADPRKVTCCDGRK